MKRKTKATPKSAEAKRVGRELLEMVAEMNSYGVVSKADLTRVKALYEEPPTYSPNLTVSSLLVPPKCRSSLGSRRATHLSLHRSYGNLDLAIMSSCTIRARRSSA